jgi:DNA primase
MSLRTRARSIDVAEVRRRHPIEQTVAAAGIELRRSGRGYLGCCPFHDDTNASLSVGGVPDRFLCFGCGASGDVIDFVGRLHGLAFRDAVAHLEQQPHQGMPLGPSRVVGGHSARRQPADLPPISPERGYEINELAWQWFSRPVPHAQAVAYLRHHRGLDMRAAELQLGEQLVGHTGHGWTLLVDQLLGVGVTDDELVAMDLAQRTRRGTLIDTLRDRVIAPIRLQDGRITGFVGRDTSSHPAAPKYRNPTRIPTFEKVTCLYRPVRTAVPDATVIVVEGPLDALAVTAVAASAGAAEQIVACTTMGTAVTASQARQVAAISTDPVVLALDGDPAGAEATLRWVDALCRQTGTLALVTRLPDGLDPADWLARHGTSGIAALHPTQRHTTAGSAELREAWPRLPGRELAALACQRPEPALRVIADLQRLAPRLNPRARDALIDGVVQEMTRQGWNPHDRFKQALIRALPEARHGAPPIARAPATRQAPELL